MVISSLSFRCPCWYNSLTQGPRNRVNWQWNIAQSGMSIRNTIPGKAVCVHADPTPPSGFQVWAISQPQSRGKCTPVLHSPPGDLFGHRQTLDGGILKHAPRVPLRASHWPEPVVFGSDDNPHPCSPCRSLARLASERYSISSMMWPAPGDRPPLCLRIPTTVSTIRRSLPAREMRSKPRRSRKNLTERLRLETVKLVWFVPRI